MILHRIAEHLRAQNWTAIVIEFVIVASGVFLGIQLGNWNDQMREKESAEILINALEAEFALIEQRTLTSVEFHRENIASLTGVLTALERGSLAEEERELFESGLRGAYMRASYMGSTKLRETVSSGRLGLVKDPQLLQALLDYEQGTELAIRTAGEIRDISTQYVPAFTARYSYDLSSDAENLYRAGGKEEDGGGSAMGFGLSRIGDYDFDAMLADPQFAEAAEELRETQRLWLNLRVINLGRIRNVRLRIDAVKSGWEE